MLMRRLRPERPLTEFLAESARRGEPFGLPIPVLMEISFGAHTNLSGGRERLIYMANWISRLVLPEAGSVLTELPVTRRAAIAAGRVLAEVPMPRKTRQGDAGQQGRAWANDVLIASVAWANGFDLVSDDSDYHAIAAALPEFRVDSPASLGFP
jgi:predicted nucleic acid-binding protein